MVKDKKLDNTEPDLFVKYDKEITEASRRAVREALLMHKRAGNPVAISRDGKVVILQPDEIEID